MKTKKKMHLLLIFVLTFTLSTQTDNTDNADNADAESTDNENKDNDGSETESDNDGMMEKVMTAFGEDGLEHLMNNIDENTLSKLMECMDKKCTLADLSDSIPSVINCMKTFKGGKAS
ncbi:hypothetical protein F3A74_24510, partial [Salmonella enterica subsp. enterica serovar Typhi]|nr:hypothetical protein [Salmonella enterica subsp. enterica serovar Typhi]